ncbi:MAG: hypothetical protein LBF50_07995, partial [Azoarcus sp.]|nr:hypothetical protein [Azoarcus sp.]
MAPIQIIVPGAEIWQSAAKIPDSFPHFRAFATAVRKHIYSRLVRDKLCIKGAESMESMRNAGAGERSLLQFVRWRYSMPHEYLVPMMTSMGGRAPPSCQITSPWIDLVVYRTPVPQVRGIVYWSERQL